MTSSDSGPLYGWAASVDITRGHSFPWARSRLFGRLSHVLADGRGPFDQCWAQSLRLDRHTLHALRKQFQAATPHLVHGRPDGRERDGQLSGQRCVVEPDDGEITSDPEALVARRAERANGREVVDRKDGSGASPRAE